MAKQEHLFGLFYECIKIDEVVKSHQPPVNVIPAKAGHAVKRQRYPELFDNNGFPPSRE
jgi:hypothetical protein